MTPYLLIIVLKQSLKLLKIHDFGGVMKVTVVAEGFRVYDGVVTHVTDGCSVVISGLEWYRQGALTYLKSLAFDLQQEYGRLNKFLDRHLTILGNVGSPSLSYRVKRLADCLSGTWNNAVGLNMKGGSKVDIHDVKEHFIGNPALDGIKNIDLLREALAPETWGNKLLGHTEACVLLATTVLKEIDLGWKL